MKKTFKFLLPMVIIFALAISLTPFTVEIAEAADTGFFSPTSTHTPNDWDVNTVANVQTLNATFASDNDEDEQGYSAFGFPVIPAGSTINGIEVVIDAKATYNNPGNSCRIDTRLSWNNGTNHSSVKNTGALTSSVAGYTLGGSSDTWGSHTWASAEFTNANFVLKIEGQDTSGNSCDNNGVSRDTIQVDKIQAKVYYTEPVQPVQNPALSNSCGLDIALVLDSSGSVNGTELGQMKDAFELFVDSFLPETPTLFSVTDFDNDGDVLQPFTDDMALLNTAINTPTSGGFTNWEDGLNDAFGTFDPRLDHSNLIVFSSDGNPTEPGSDAEALTAAIVKANAIKTAGTRIIALGIGDDLNIDNLEAISGPDAVYTSNFETLATDLANLAAELCGGTITVHKVIDVDGDRNTTEDQTTSGVTVENWEYSVEPEGTPTNPVATDDSGVTSSVEVDPGTYSVSENVKNGYDLIDAVCTGATENGAFNDDLNAVENIAIEANDIVSCTFYNTLVPEPNEAVISATKIICSAEEYLPNWGDGDAYITSTTADEFLAYINQDPEIPVCWKAEWTFERAPDGIDNPGDNTGAAGGAWTAFNSTAVVPAGSLVWVREVWDSNYIPFSSDTDGDNGWEDVSAEFYCHTNVQDYDNYGWIDPVEKGETYYCVGFNVQESKETYVCSDGEDNDGDHLIDYPADKGCSNPQDNDEENDGGISSGGRARSSGGQVLGAATDICSWTSSYMRRGWRGNVPADVMKVQNDLLNQNQGNALAVDGIYGPLTEAAVKAFQARYANEILAPWGISAPTGHFYLSSLHQAQKLLCPTVEDPLPPLINWSQNPLVAR